MIQTAKMQLPCQKIIAKALFLTAKKIEACIYISIIGLVQKCMHVRKLSVPERRLIKKVTEFQFFNHEDTSNTKSYAIDQKIYHQKIFHAHLISHTLPTFIIQNG